MPWKRAAVEVRVGHTMVEVPECGALEVFGSAYHMTLEDYVT